MDPKTDAALSGVCARFLARYGRQQAQFELRSGVQLSGALVELDDVAAIEDDHGEIAYVAAAHVVAVRPRATPEGWPVSRLACDVP